MANTDDDRSLRGRLNTDIRSKLSLLLVVLSVLCGLSSLVLCLAAEFTRSKVTLMLTRVVTGIQIVLLLILIGFLRPGGMVHQEQPG